MVTLVFRAKMKPGKEDEAVKAMTKMAETVQAQEPGALAYVLHRLQEDPSTIVLYEQYADDAAFQSHTGTTHMGEIRSAFADLFDTTQVKVERLEHVAGFTRGS